MRPIWNTFGRITGAEFPDEWIIIGGHRDAWCCGAVDNVSGVTTVIYALKVAALTFTPAAGTYNAEQTVVIATPTEGAAIRYTTDGSTPSATAGIPLASGGAVAVDREGVHIGFSDGAATLTRVRPAGRGSMDGAAYARGARLPEHASWGPAQ